MTREGEKARPEIGSFGQALVEDAREIATSDLQFELGLLADAADAYMRHHAEKFYADSPIGPTGLWPAIERARAAIAKARG